MKIGLIGRCERWRGLAIQSKNFYDNVPVDKVLLVRMPPQSLDCDERPEWYPGAAHIEYDSRFHQLDERVVMEFFDGLDVVFSVETPYDWRLPDWARRAGVKTVIQGNPEFYRNDQAEFAHQAEPDAWWWPTPWRIDRLPRGQVMPVPMPDMAPTAATNDERLRFLHVIGKRAYGDRNGTDIVIAALRAIEEPCDLTIHGVGWELPEVPVPFGSPVRLEVERVGIEDRWAMYENQHVLLMPRRYGGLCLPALEAAACGLAVMMPDVSPNETMASLFVSGRTDLAPIRLAAGHIQTVDVSHMELARRINELCRDPAQVRHAMTASQANVPRWSEMRQVYLDELERVCSQP